MGREPGSRRTRTQYLTMPQTNQTTTEIPSFEQFSTTEKKLLLFLECAATDYGGAYQPEAVNDEDREIMDRWRACGFVDHGRIASKSLPTPRPLWVKLSPEAIKVAHACRAERAARMWRNRTWQTTAETRARN